MRYGRVPAQLHADRAYDIAGRPRVLHRRRSSPATWRQPVDRLVCAWHVHNRP
jgi:hypothetical protein